MKRIDGRIVDCSPTVGAAGEWAPEHSTFEVGGPALEAVREAQIKRNTSNADDRAASRRGVVLGRDRRRPRLGQRGYRLLRPNHDMKFAATARKTIYRIGSISKSIQRYAVRAMAGRAKRGHHTVLDAPRSRKYLPEAE
jgi:hypothetical protein